MTEIKSIFKSLEIYKVKDSVNYRKQAEIDRKKAEVRARLEAQAAGKKSKKGFMTPERKKKLRVISLPQCHMTHKFIFLFILVASP